MAYIGVQSEGLYGICECVRLRYSCDVYIILYGCYNDMTKSISSFQVIYDDEGLRRVLIE